MHDQHQEFFDNLAAEWDFRHTTEDRERLSHLIERLGVSDGMSVLDLGCATGILFDLLRRKVGRDGMVTGVDFSIRMVRRARRNFPFPNVMVVDAEASNLPFLDSTYDMGISLESFPHFPRQKQTLGEMGRVLKPAAMFHIVSLASAKEVSEIHRHVGGIVKHDELPAEEELRRMFVESHFGQVQIKDHPGLFLASAVNAK